VRRIPGCGVRTTAGVAVMGLSILLFLDIKEEVIVKVHKMLKPGKGKAVFSVVKKAE
jgi:hypothetical protein